ncbi:MAG TPA: potassium channel protein [Pirellulales bacterium]|nr:potassium channel protein [Pirellulales bacterium]
MNGPFRRMLIGGTFFLLTCVVGVAGYMIIAGWSLLDAIYMVVITVFSVGYGEVRPLDDPVLRTFTIAIIIAGCSSGIYVVGGFVSMIAEGEINKALGGRRMAKDIDKLSNHTIICGFGRVGQMLAHDLAKANQEFVIIDSNEERVSGARNAGYLVLKGSASDEETLEAAGIGRARVLATVLPDDTTNVFITLSARELNSTMEIIARAESPSTEKKLLRSGATRIVLPALIGATKIAQMILRPTADDLLQEATGTAYLNDELKAIGLEMMEISVQANSPMCDQAIVDLEVSGGCVIVAIRQPNGHCIRNPTSDVKLTAGDVLIILGHQGALPQLARKARARAAVSFRGNTQ